MNVSSNSVQESVQLLCQDGTFDYIMSLQHFMPDTPPVSCTQLIQFQKQSHFLEGILRAQDADHQQEV